MQQEEFSNDTMENCDKSQLQAINVNEHTVVHKHLWSCVKGRHTKAKLQPVNPSGLACLAERLKLVTTQQLLLRLRWFPTPE